GLLPAAAAPAAGVTLVTDVDSKGRERWVNGVEVFPFPAGPALAWNACAHGTDHRAKHDSADFTNPQFGALTLYLEQHCKTYKTWDDAEYKARIALSYEAVESAGLATEFLGGYELPLNPHLADGNGTFPNGDTPTSPV